MRARFKAARFPAKGPAYTFSLGLGETDEPKEGAQVRFAWDESGFHVFAELVDSNLVVTRPVDEELHFQYGDVLELFLKPLNETYKWEMYATPSGNKSTLFFPDWPTDLTPEQALSEHSFRALELSVEETSRGWNAHLFVPAVQLTALGTGWGDGTEWTVLCGRYNYNRFDLQEPELSMTPPLSAVNYHLNDEYALLELVSS